MQDENNEIIDAEVLEKSSQNLTPASKKQDILSERTDLVKKYYGESSSFFEKLKKSQGTGENIDELVGIIIEEIAKESDNLLGNSLIFTKDGNLHDASVISVKRADMLETLTKVLQRKKEMFIISSKIDYDSPVFKIFQIICFEKLTAILDALTLDVEMKQLIVSRWVDSMKDWQKEIKLRVDNAGTQ